MIIKSTKNFKLRRRINPPRHINLDITPYCNLKCPGCHRQKIYSDGEVPGEVMSVKNFEKIADYFDKIYLCGQVSDPSFHPDLKSLLEVVVSKNKRVAVSIASSWRQPLWFEELFNYSAQHSNNISWVFGIDGLPKDSHKYRKNQDGEKLFSMMELCASKGIQTSWQYIAFNYNENDIEEAKMLAKQIGVTFKLIKSCRWESKHGLDKYKPNNPDLFITRSFSYNN